VVDQAGISVAAGLAERVEDPASTEWHDLDHTRKYLTHQILLRQA
jgi:hypothetical protein